MTVVRFHTTEITNAEVSWRFSVRSIPADGCRLLAGPDWSPRSTDGIRSVVLTLTEGGDGTPYIDRAPFPTDIEFAIRALVSAATDVDNPRREYLPHRQGLARTEFEDITALLDRQSLTLDEVEMINHLLLAPVIPVERSYPKPESLTSLLVDAGGGAAATLAVSLAGVAAPWVVVAYPAGIVLVSVARGVVGRVRGFFDRDVEARLRTLHSLREQGLISTEDLDARRQQVLDENYGQLG